jgi:hypothetical protein
MMTYTHWKSQTKRGIGSPRSKLLKAIDDALEAYHLSKGTVTLTALFRAVKAWIDKKGAGWKGSIRNTKLEAGGKGTVETLLREIVAAGPQFQGEANRYLTQAAAPPRAPLMDHGAKNHHVDVDGHHYDLVVQNKENSCGPASLRTVIKLVQNEDVGEDYLRDIVEALEEGGIHDSGYAGSLGKGGVLVSGGAHDWDPSGGGTWLVPAALAAAKIPNTQGASTAPLLQTTNKKPAIAVVAWTAGGLHYVVVAGLTKARPARLVILDPFYGLQYADVTGTTIGNYVPVNSQGTVLSRATWHPLVCKVN